MVDEPKTIQTEQPSPEKRSLKRGDITAAAVVLVIVGFVAGVLLLGREEKPGIRVPDWIDQQIIGINGTGRRSTVLGTVNNIAVHYVGNPGTTAMQNRNYFNQPTTTVSSHFIVGLDGEIVQCVPLDEVSSATNHRNSDTISIEVCHPDTTGKFNEKTYRSLIRLCRWLCDEYGLEATDLIRHYDVTGKRCPLYYVEHPDAWDQLVQDVANYEE